MKRPTRTATLAIAVLLLTACGGEVGDEPGTEPPATGEDPVDLDDPDGDMDDDMGDDMDQPGDDPAAGSSDPLLGPEVESAIADVTERAGVDRGDVQVEVTELVTWPDGSLGCPDPDMMYTQALVDGYRIVLAADGEAYHYHGANGDDPRYCADPESPVE